MFLKNRNQLVKKRIVLKRRPIFVVNRIVSNITGLNQAMFQRANSLSKYGDSEIYIVCFHFDPKHYEVLSENLMNQGKITDKVKVINMFEYLRGESGENDKYVENIDCPKYSIEEKANSKRYFLNGRYIKYEKYDADGLIERTDYFNDSRYNYKSEVHDRRGNLVREQYKDLVTGEPKNELYFRKDGSVYMSKWFKWNETKKRNTVMRINLFDKNENLIKVLHSDEQLKHYFLDLIVNDGPAMILAEARSVDNVVLNYKNKHVKKYAIVHNMHMEPPYEDFSNLNIQHEKLLNNVDKLEGLIILTNKQKEDIAKLIGSEEKLRVISHANAHQVKKDRSLVLPNRIVAVGRLADQKRMDHTIKAMKIVREHYPDIKLDIYGEGSEREVLQSLILELDLVRNVELHGFSKSTLEEYQKATLSVLTSKYEGFGLVILESLSQGCPVIAYDIKYGPSDMVEDGTNGYLVEEGNVQKLAERIIQILESPELQKKLSKGAIQTVEKFSEEKFVNKWVEVINQ